MVQESYQGCHFLPTKVGAVCMRVYGKTLDAQTRCVHYHSELDIVAIKFKCCGKFYPCYKCHKECETHPIARWSKAEFGEEAILCGACGNTLSIAAYVGAEACPHCGSLFNPGCALHYGIYFDVDATDADGSIGVGGGTACTRA